VWRQYISPFTPFVSFVCAAASGIITGLVRTSPEAYCPASTVVSVVLHAVALAVALIVRPSVFAYDNFIAVVSDAFTLGAAICTLVLAQADSAMNEDRGVALKSAVQVMGVIATVVSTSGAVLSLARTACMALGQVKAVPLAQFLRDVDARIEWFLLADVEGDGDIWI
jgi:ABC-type antimicrobial peptide transport system ATPase subunit